MNQLALHAWVHGLGCKPDFWDDAIVKDDVYNKTKKANGWKTP